MRTVVTAYLQEPLSSYQLSIDKQIDSMAIYQIDSYSIEYLEQGIHVRNELDNLLSNLNKEDVVIVCNATLLGDSLEQIRSILVKFYERGAQLIFIQEGLSTIGKTYQEMYALLEKYYHRDRINHVSFTMTLEEKVRLRALYIRTNLPVQTLSAVIGRSDDEVSSFLYNEMELWN